MSSRWSQALLLASILLLVATMARPWVPPILAVPPGTQITCAEPIWSTGPVFSGQSRRHEFVIRNSGRSAVTVQTVTASCGCTTYAPEIVGKRIEAGQSLNLPVTWNVLAQPGKQHKQVHVHFEEWQNWSLPLDIEGEVQAEYVLSSPQLSFGTIANDVPVTQEATITFAEGAPAGRITRSECNHTGLSIAVEDTPDSRQQKIIVQTVPPLNPGRLSTNILLLTENGSLVLPVLAAVEAGP